MILSKGDLRKYFLSYETNILLLEMIFNSFISFFFFIQRKTLKEVLLPSFLYSYSNPIIYIETKQKGCPQGCRVNSHRFFLSKEYVETKYTTLTWATTTIKSPP